MRAAKASLTVARRPRVATSKASTRSQTPREAPAADLIIVAGISGSGKSTFLEQIQSGYVPEGLVLPAGAKDWPVVGTKRPAWPANASGVILHYDMSGRGLWNGADFSDDAPLALIGRAKAVMVITLCPPIDCVIHQLTERESPKLRIRTEKLKRKQGQLIWRLSAPAMRAGDYVLPRRIMSAIRRRTPFCDVQEALHTKFRIYAQPGLIDELFTRWRAYLDSVARSGKPVQQIFLEPDTESFRWRQVPALRPQWAAVSPLPTGRQAAAGSGANEREGSIR